MALNAAVLGALIKDKMIAADPSVTNPAMVETFANAIAEAFVLHIQGAAIVTIPASAIVTTGSAATQTGPAAPLLLSIT